MRWIKFPEAEDAALLLLYEVSCQTEIPLEVVPENFIRLGSLYIPCQDDWEGHAAKRCIINLIERAAREPAPEEHK